MRFKRGQVTIFIIIAIVIVALIVIGFLVFPKIKTNLGLGGTSPSLFIQTCLQDTIKNTVQEISLHGGSVEPRFSILHDNEKVEYLCYTSEYYKTCIVQQPMLKPHIENEIKTDIEDETKDCFDSLEENYRRQGYEVNLKRTTMNVELLPKRVVANFNYTLTLTKVDTQRYESFSVVLNNNLYELTGIANSIVEWETTLGNADTSTYMTYYTDLKVEKKIKSDGTKVYIITDLNTGNKFQFASRSQVLPAGYD
ncbi:MAG: hypothetical protein Q7S06_01220 [Nanoarchaeota archaeon]|nr:hypothetical protein [Nanoarchaeota archaeon]